jgi:myo-inositol-1(or 4)-monophosphatase
MLLISEAGGMVTDAEGGDDIVGSGSICAANLELHPLLIEKLKAAA